MDAGALAMITGLVAVLLGGLFILIPVIGFTLRFALRPWIDRILGIMEARQQTQLAGDEMRRLEHRLALLEQEMHLNGRQLQELSERSEFYEKLSEPNA